MGVFLAAPLLERLNQCAPGSGLDAQLILEILVPLVYRPAIKVQPLLYGVMATFHHPKAFFTCNAGLPNSTKKKQEGRNLEPGPSANCWSQTFQSEVGRIFQQKISVCKEISHWY